ncbi:MAG: ankyrin repeat domain-containing protein [Acidiferrobacterales bacterium]
MSCSHTKNCELFPQFALNPALKVWQVHFCEGEFSRCARFQLSLQGKTVPLNLLPNGKRVETPRSSNAYGAAALFNAILKDRAHMVESLLRTGVNIGTRNAEGMTPLMAAASRGNTAIIRLLLTKGSEINTTNLHGSNAYDMAVQNGFPEAAELIAAGGGRPTGTSAPALEAASHKTEQPFQQPAPARVEMERHPELAPPDSNPQPAQTARVVPLSAERARAADSGYTYCLRIPTSDARALAQQITHTCNDCHVAIEVMVQKATGGDQHTASVIVLTGQVADQDTALRIVQRLQSLEAVSGPVSCMRLEALVMPEFARTAP